MGSEKQAANPPGAKVTFTRDGVKFEGVGASPRVLEFTWPQVMAYYDQLRNHPFDVISHGHGI